MTTPFVRIPEPDHKLADELIRKLKDAHWSDKPESLGMHAYGYTKAEQEAIDIVVTEAMKQGMEAFSDLAGNTYLIKRGQSSAKTDVIVSHLDTVEKGGAHDGRDGIVAGISVVAGLNKAGKLPAHDMCVMIARSEESCVNGTVSIGAKLATGKMKIGELNNLKDRKSGKGVLEKMTELGIPTATLVGKLDGSPTLFPTGDDAKNLIGFLAEPHIEQGNYCAKENAEVGIVSSIRGNTRFLNCEIKSLAPDDPKSSPISTYVKLMDAAEKWFAEKQKDHDVVFTPAILNTTAGNKPLIPPFADLNQQTMIYTHITGQAAHSGATFEEDRADAVRAFVKLAAAAEEWVTKKNQSGPRIVVTPMKALSTNESATTVANNCTFVLDVHSSSRALIDEFHTFMEREAAKLESNSLNKNLRANVLREAPPGQGSTHGRTPAGKLNCSFEIRSAEEGILMEFADFIRTKIAELRAQDSNINIAHSIPGVSAPATMDQGVMDHAQWVAKKLGIKTGMVTSGAGHDTVQFSNTGTPSVMLFIRQKNPLSHNPEEARSTDSFRKACKIISGMVMNPTKTKETQAGAPSGAKSFTDYIQQQGAKPYTPGQPL